MAGGGSSEGTAMEITTPNIGDEIRIRGCLHQWLACPLCGQGRWVRLEKGVPRSEVCRRCCSAETRKKMSESGLGRPCLQETRDKISEAKMGHIGHMLGKLHTEETKQKLSMLSQGRLVSDTTREKIRQALLGRIGHKHTEETKEKLRLSHLGRQASPETRERLRLSHLGYKPSPEAREKMSTATKVAMSQPGRREKALRALHCPLSRYKSAQKRTGRPRTLETKAKISASLMGHEFSEETRAKWLISMRKSLHIKPNQKEIQLLQLLNVLYPDEWAFVGDWSMILAGKNPDFVNVNGKKQIIELFGDYWHKGENPEERIALFSKFGYKTLVIWERELTNVPEVTVRIREFVG